MSYKSEPKRKWGITRSPKSNCCQAPIKTAGNPNDPGSTNYYICTKCLEPCDAR